MSFVAAVRVAGESMINVGIFPGDIAVVNRARRVTDKCIVIALVDGEFTLKRYRKRSGRVWLQVENPSFKDISRGFAGNGHRWRQVSALLTKRLNVHLPREGP